MRQIDAGELEPPPIAIKGTSYSHRAAVAPRSAPQRPAGPGSFDAAAEQAKLAAYLAQMEGAEATLQRRQQDAASAPSGEQLRAKLDAALGYEADSDSSSTSTASSGSSSGSNADALPAVAGAASEGVLRRRPGRRAAFRRQLLSRRGSSP